MPASSKASARSEALSFSARALVRRIQNFGADQSLWAKRERFIVGVSGGPDSIFLLDILVYLSKKYDWRLHVAHVNYRLRKRDSELDEQFVRERARAYGLTCSFFHPAAPGKGNIEEKLRLIRYRIFENIRKRKNYDAIMVGHNADDQAETLILRLLRGSGLQGLAAMAPKRERVLRPLLETSREEILSYLKNRGLSYREDKTNKDPQFLRNRIRNELLPYLEISYEPSIKKILARTADQLGSDYHFLETAREQLILRENKDAVEFSQTQALALPPALLRNQLRKLMRPYCEGRNPSRGLTDEAMKLLKSSKSKKQKLTSHGLIFERNGDTVRLLNFPAGAKKSEKSAKKFLEKR